MPETPRKRRRLETDADENFAATERASEPTRLIFTTSDFVLDDLLEEPPPTAATEAHDAALVEIDARLKLVISTDLAGEPAYDAMETDGDLSEADDGGAAASAGPSADGTSRSPANGSDDVSNNERPPVAPSKQRQRRKKKHPANADREGQGAGQPIQKKSTRDNCKRREKRKKSESRRRVLLRSLLDKALKHTKQLDLRALPHSQSSYLGSHSKSNQFQPGDRRSRPQKSKTTPQPSNRTHPRLQELLSQGYTVVDSHSAPDLIFDGSDRLGAWKPGSFGNPGYWDSLIRGLSRSFRRFANGIPQTRSKQKGKGNASGGAPRGQHAWTKWGYSFGGGEQKPLSTAHQSRKERRLWKEFLACPYFIEVTKRLMDSFEMWAPDVYQKYDRCHRHVLSQLQALDCINPEDPHSVPFAALTANLGPQTVCWPHRDIKNLAHGVCIILVLGLFNYHYGGHIVLHEPRLILEMKPGDVVFLPSAVITHETIPIQAGETRYSLVFYSAGGLFRWQDCASRTKTDFAAEDPEGCGMHFSTAKAEERWTAGWSCFPTLQELRENAGVNKALVAKPSLAGPISLER